ncbi:MAG TPA: alanine racemase [Myxococcales bacterium]
MADRLTVSRSQMAFAPENRFNRPTVAEVDLDALLCNLEATRQLCPKARLLAVVKANAYGHGAVPVTVALEKAGVDFFGVSLVEEGVELRQYGIRGDILVMGGAYSDYQEIVTHDLVPIVFTAEHLVRLEAAAERAGRPVRAHLKVDTGMNRLGILPEELPEFLRYLSTAPHVVVDGLMSHLANADVGDHYMTRLQIRRFRDAAAALRAAGHPISWRHISNSAAALDLDEVKDGEEFNLVRPGIMLYGEYPAEALREKAKLEPVLTWKTSITHLKKVGPGQSVSYGGKWTTPRESLVATLPVGYADGYNRHMTNRGEVLVRGKRAKVVGTVCMDMCMVDVTAIPGASVHDEVVLLGRQGGEVVTAQEFAQKCETIPYEILCAVGARVPRAVVQRRR